MAFGSRKIMVEIIGDASSLEKAFGKAEKSGRSFGGAMGKVGKVAAFTAGGAALGGLFVTLKRGTDEFVESERAAAQTTAAIKSTGRAAGVTTRQVQKLADKISLYSGADDEAVQSGANMLLTFTKIRNGVGKNNKIFDKATETLVDMATAMNGGAAPSAEQLRKQAVQLGKALNDPIRGISALRRVGVSFTEDQKKQIEQLVKTGHTMEAQKIILRELNTEFGGSAKAAGSTFSGSLNKLRNTFDNLAGTIVGAAAPAIQKYVDRLNKWLSNSKNQEKVQRAVEKVTKDVAAAVKTLVHWVEVIAPKVQAVVDKLGGWKTVLAAIIALKFASKVAGWANSFATLTGNAKTATKTVKGLAGTLARLPATIPIAIALTLIFNHDVIEDKVNDWLRSHGLGKFAAKQVMDWSAWENLSPGEQDFLRDRGFDPSKLPGAPHGAGTRRNGGGTRTGGGGTRGNVAFGVSPIAAQNAGVFATTTTTINVGTVVANDPTTFLRELQKKARQQSPSRAGRFGGHNLGLA